MWKYVLKRLLLALITTFIIISLTFILIKLLPFEPAIGEEKQVYAFYMSQVHQNFVKDFTELQTGYGDLLWKHADSEGVMHYYYQTPVLEQYFSWIKNIVTEWNWGTSTGIMKNESAMVIIAQRLPYSIKINIWSVLISVPIGIALGIWAALKKNTVTDHTISTAVMIFISIPSFIIITFLIGILGYALHWVPTSWPADTAPAGTKFLGYIIPELALSFGSIAGYTRFVRAELCEVMESDYLLLARTKGLTKRQAILRHALRNAMVPIVPSILAEFIGILGGSMILESLYGIPGIGRLYITALGLKDYNVVLVDMAVYTTLSLTAGVLLDISYGFIDPRIRMGSKK